MKTKIIAALMAIIAATGAVCAQNGIITPYSRYGYGVLRDNATAAQQSMGGIGYAMSSGRQTNVMNPASYARIDSLTYLFDMGMDFTSLWSSEIDPEGNKLSENNLGGGLNYITMQFPLGKRLGMSMGILPYSSVGYAFGNTIDNGYTNRQGSGSINKLYLGIGARIVAGLNAGVNISYLFGSTVNDTYAITNSGSQSLYEDELTVRDWHIDAGLMYTLPIGIDDLTIGLTYSPAKSVLGHLRTYAYDVDAESNATEHSRVNTKDLFSMASTYGAGINYRHGYKAMIEADFTYQPWSKEKYN
ncbi:MAG: PorT family protein, partial [Muribaculaceae bacterium]|nr:PorT family protein [Muribaculaceae bacterium]